MNRPASTSASGLRLAAALAALLAAAPAADAAETVNGSFNTSLGYLAGKDASGERTTVMGAGAGGEMTGANRTDLVGAGAGVRSKGLVDCVGIGYRALRGSTNMENVVAIGKRAFENRSGVSDATWINGQFYAEGGEFFIKPDPATPDEDAPIRYSGGSLYLNAAHVYLKGGASRISATNDAETVGFDVYVSQSRGSDYNDGLTEETPVKTLDRAYDIAPDGGSVAVFAGSYTYPRGYATNLYTVGATKRLAFHGVDGAARTLMVRGEGDIYDGKIVGSTSTWTTFSNWTFRHVKGRAISYRSTPFLFTRFRDCVFSGLVTTNEYYGATWLVCALEGCVIRDCTFEGGHGGGSADYDHPFVFSDCLLTGCLVDGVRITNGSIAVFFDSHVEDSFIHVKGKASNVSRQEYATSRNFGTVPGAVDSTVLVEEVADPNFARTYHKPVTGNRLVGCLVGVDGLTNLTSVTESAVTNYAAAVAAVDGDTFRVSREADRRLWFYGYGTGADRRTKDVVAEEVLTMLAEAETAPAAVKSLSTARLSSMSADAAARTEATTNFVGGVYSMPAGGLSLSLPERDDEGDEDAEADGTGGAATNATETAASPASTNATDTASADAGGAADPGD